MQALCCLHCVVLVLLIFFSLTCSWTACSNVIDIQRDWNRALISDALAREPWRSGKWIKMRLVSIKLWVLCIVISQVIVPLYILIPIYYLLLFIFWIFFCHWLLYVLTAVVKFEVLMAVTLKIMFFWTLTLCNLVDECYFRGTCCPYLQGSLVSAYLPNCMMLLSRRS